MFFSNVILHFVTATGKLSVTYLFSNSLLLHPPHLHVGAALHGQEVEGDFLVVPCVDVIVETKPINRKVELYLNFIKLLNISIVSMNNK